ncbi:hypothetical protein RCL1_007738 [Eukaryota sp. TZLM3-RCL]
MMLQAYDDSINELDCVFLNSKVKAIEGLQLDDTERELLKETLIFFEPFYEVTVALSYNKSITQGLSMSYLFALHTHVESVEGATQRPWLKLIASKICTVFGKYKQHIESTGSYISAVLHPRCKNQMIPEIMATESNFEQLKSIWKLYCQEESDRQRKTVELNSTVVGSLQKTVVASRKSRLLCTIEAKRRALDDSDITELDSYLVERLKPVDMDPLLYWKLYNQEHPDSGLAMMARSFLSIQATSVAVEQLFSSAGRTVNEKRESMNDETVTSLVFLKSLLQNEFTLK